MYARQPLQPVSETTTQPSWLHRRVDSETVRDLARVHDAATVVPHVLRVLLDFDDRVFGEILRPVHHRRIACGPVGS